MKKKGLKIIRSTFFTGILLLSGISAVGLYYVKDVCAQNLVIAQLQKEGQQSAVPPCHSKQAKHITSSSPSSPSSPFSKDQPHAGICCTTGEFSSKGLTPLEVKKPLLLAFVHYSIVSSTEAISGTGQRDVGAMIAKSTAAPPPFSHIPTTVLRP